MCIDHVFYVFILQIFQGYFEALGSIIGLIRRLNNVKLYNVYLDRII